MDLPVRENKMTTDRKLILATCAVVMALTSPLRADSGHAAPRSHQQSHPLAATSSIDWTHDVTFAYDSSGNIKAIGADRYYYDTAGRLGYGSVEGSANTQAYGYDPFGNRITVTTATAVGCIGSCGFNAPADPSTNHLYSAVYDDAGSVGTSDGATYTYDGEAMIKHASDSGADFVYTADGERVATVRAGVWSWDVRDLAGDILRAFRSQDTGSAIAASNLTWTEDDIYRGGQMLAALLPSGAGIATENFHLDHLGTPRLITDATGHRLASHSYFPFGAELALSPTESPVEERKFTGHERDSFGTGHDLDYMHARYYSSTLSRFLSPDKVGSSQTSRPQSWNRYVYGSNNPLRFVDPNGLAVVNFTVLTHGPNYVKGPVTELGPENVYGGFNYNTNVQVQMEASDNLQDYTVERDAQILGGEFRTGDSGDKREDPDDPGQINRDGANHSLFVFDGPGKHWTNKETGLPMQPSGLNSDGSGTYNAIFELRVVNKKTHAYDPQRGYFGVSVQYQNGRIVKATPFTLTPKQYFDLVRQKKKDKPHRQ